MKTHNTPGAVEINNSSLRDYELRAAYAKYTSLRTEPYRVLTSLTQFVASLLNCDECQAEDIVLGRVRIVHMETRATLNDRQLETRMK